MMLADPGGMKADLLGIKRLAVDLADELLGRARVVGIAVVRQREIAEIHLSPPRKERGVSPVLVADASDGGGRPPRAPQKNRKARTSMLSRAGASDGVAGSAKAVWTEMRARPSRALSKHLMSTVSSALISGK